MITTAGNSLGMLDCINMNVLLHIPHSSTEIPSWQKYEIDPIDEITLLTDWASEEIFNLPYYEQIIFPYSRVFCDVERFASNEPMEEVGMGFFYTHTDDGKVLRLQDNKEKVYHEYYKPYHKKLHDTIEKMLNKFGEILIIDCHTFSDKPFIRDINQETKRADICLGTTSLNTKDLIIQHYKNYFTKKGYSVAINQLYSGSMIPLKYIGKANVQTIMIEINRKLYMDNNQIDSNKVKHFNKLMKASILPLELIS